MKKIRISINQIPEIVIDLYIGLLIYFCIFECIGLVFAERKIPYTLGLIVGVGASMGLVTHMFTTIDTALDLLPGKAEKYIRFRSVFRWLVMFGLASAGVFFTQLSVYSIVIGFFGIKIAAFSQPVINQYITKKFFKKGR